jgi:hypothetical protein
MKKIALISSVLLLTAALSAVQLLNAQEPSSAPLQPAMKAADTKVTEEPASTAAKQEEIYILNRQLADKLDFITTQNQLIIERLQLIEHKLRQMQNKSQ